jgi:hypothetical protein
MMTRDRAGPNQVNGVNAHRHRGTRASVIRVTAYRLITAREFQVMTTKH